MPEEVIIEKSKPVIGKIVIWAVVSAIVFGGLGYYLGKKSATETESSATATSPGSGTLTTTNSATTTTSKAAATATTSATDETASWKTYTNDAYGFSFKYPSGWTAEDSTSSSHTNCKVICSYTSFTQSNSFWTQVIDFDEFSNSINNGTFNDKTLLGYVKYSQGTDGLTATTINGSEVVKMKKTNPDDSNGYSAGFFLMKNSKIYAVHANYLKTDTFSNSILDQILSTFEFTK